MINVTTHLFKVRFAVRRWETSEKKDMRRKNEHFNAVFAMSIDIKSWMCSMQFIQSVMEHIRDIHDWHMND